MPNIRPYDSLETTLQVQSLSTEYAACGSHELSVQVTASRVELEDLRARLVALLDWPQVGNTVRYVGKDERHAGLEGEVIEADYTSRVPLVVMLPSGPPGIGICLNREDVIVLGKKS